MTRIAMCIPTYNRSDCIEELLNICVSYYKKYNIDIYVFDSSEDRNTEFIIQNNTYCKDVYYYSLKKELSDIPLNFQGNYKVYMIYRFFANNEDYDYIWICGDRIRFHEIAVKVLLEIISETCYDMIVFRADSRIKVLQSVAYKDPVQFVEKLAGYMMLFGGTLVQRKTMLKNVQWDKMEKKYINSESIYASHVAFYAEKLAELNSFEGLQLDVPDGYWRTELLVDKGWREDGLKILLHSWPKTMYKLPDDYDDKQAIVKSGLGLTSVCFERNILEYVARGILDKATFDRYRDEFMIATDMDESEIERIVSLEPRVVQRIIKHKKEAFSNFCNLHKELIIYGTGIVARNCMDDIFRFNGVRIKYFLQTVVNSKYKYYGKEIFSFEDKADELNGEYVVLAMNKKYVEEVYGNLKKIMDIDRVFIYS